LFESNLSEAAEVIQVDCSVQERALCSSNPIIFAECAATTDE